CARVRPEGLSRPSTSPRSVAFDASHRSVPGGFMSLRPPVALLVLCLLAAACGRSAETRRQYAELYAQRGDYVHASEEWTRAIAKKPADATLWLGRGRSQRKARDFGASRA